jgi:hypothetical protein
MVPERSKRYCTDALPPVRCETILVKDLIVRSNEDHRTLTLEWNVRLFTNNFHTKIYLILESKFSRE